MPLFFLKNNDVRWLSVVKTGRTLHFSLFFQMTGTCNLPPNLSSCFSRSRKIFLKNKDQLETGPGRPNH
jgi:hypothetical protein